MIDLSILVCSIHTRHDTFLPKIQAQLYGQLAALSPSNQSRVEIITLTDNQTLMLGHKRNLLVDMAQGEYVVFVDDDDRVSEDYISTLLTATTSDTDAIVFQASVSLNGNPPRICYYSIDNERDYDTPTAYYRVPNHICCVKRSLALLSSFPNILYREDTGYSKILLPHLKTEHKIDKVLYYYDYNIETTAAQQHRRNKSKPRKFNPVVDVVILSKAVNQVAHRMTQRAIDSCINGANWLPVNIIVMEGGGGEYENATTIPVSSPFNYNLFANRAARLGTAEWIMVANNDVVFGDGWLHPLIAADNDVVSPREPNDPRQKSIKENTLGDKTGKHFSGWCYMIKRTLWEEIGYFDTDVDFWCSDDVVIEQVKAAGVTPMLVYDSIVEHIGSATLKTLPRGEQLDLMWRNVHTFNTKYGKTKFANNPQYKAWLKTNKVRA